MSIVIFGPLLEMLIVSSGRLVLSRRAKTVRQFAFLSIESPTSWLNLRTSRAKFRGFVTVWHVHKYFWRHSNRD